MAINFPSNPSNEQQVTLAGTTYTYNSAKTKWEIRNLFTSSVFDSAEVVSIVDSSYVSSRQEAAGVTVYANRSSLPASGNTAGDQAYVTANNRLYIWNGTGWYSIALLNLAPSIQSVLDSDNNTTTPFALATDGTPTTITITAVDSDGDSITYGYSADSNFGGLATLSQANNVFTITPFSEDSATTTSGTITFTATDDVNVASSGVQTFTLNFLSPLWDETILSIGTSSTNSLNNSAFIDRSTNSHTVTSAGTPTQTAFHPYLDNWSVYGGTNGVLTIPTSSDFNMGNGDFTIDCWINTTRDGGRIFDHGGNYLVTYNGMRWDWKTTTGYLEFIMNQQSNSASGEYTITGSTKVNDGQWHHLRVCRNGTTFRMFVDGVLDISGTSSVTGYQPSTDMVLLGALNNNTPTSEFAYSYLSDFHMIKGTSLSTTNDSFNVPTASSQNVAGTVLHVFTSNRFIDISTYNRNITLYNTPEISALNPFGQGSEYAVGENKGSAYFDGNGDYLSLANVDSLRLGSGDFTIDGWIYPNRVTNTYTSGIFGTYGYVSNQDRGWLIGLNSSGYLILIMYGASGSGFTVTSSQIPTINQWSYIAAARSGTTVKLYLNGIEVGSGTSSKNEDWTNSEFHVGTFRANSLSPNVGISTTSFQGNITSCRIIKGTALYTSNFTPPTAPVSNTNTSLYLPMDNAGIFDKSSNTNLTLVGNAETSNTQTKHATTSLYLPTAYVVTDELPRLGNVWTVEGWFYPTVNASNDKALISYGYPSGGIQGFVIYTTSGSYYYLYATSNNNSWDIANNFNTNIARWSGSWKHIAITQDGSNWRFFLDGTQTATFSNSAMVFSASSYKWAIASSITGTNTHETLYVEDFQVLNGVAKYTTNFTPPIQTQGRTYQAED